MTSQRQEGGDHSTNIQAQHISLVQGPSLAEVRQIAIDVFKANFQTLAGEAAETARRRAEEITDNFLEKLVDQNKEGLRHANDPDFQCALLTVQKEYARTGDKDLGDLLIDLLVDRNKEDQRSVLQIILNEALSVAPKLTVEQLAILSVVFMIKHTKHKGLDTLQALSDYLDSFFKPFVEQLSMSATNLRHLEYCSCATVPPLIGFDLGTQFFLKQYPGLFCKGFDAEELGKRQLSVAPSSDLLTQCLHESAKLQLNGLDEDVFRRLAADRMTADTDITKLIALNKEFLMKPDEIKDYLTRVNPYMVKLYDVWKNSHLQAVALTSVGIAIGHANVKKNVGRVGNLSIWLD